MKAETTLKTGVKVNDPTGAEKLLIVAKKSVNPPFELSMGIQIGVEELYGGDKKDPATLKSFTARSMSSDETTARSDDDEELKRTSRHFGGDDFSLILTSIPASSVGISSIDSHKRRRWFNY
ncbi:hypothetical protein Bca4012_066356 [Brassica carinata]